MAEDFLLQFVIYIGDCVLVLIYEFNQNRSCGIWELTWEFFTSLLWYAADWKEIIVSFNISAPLVIKGFWELDEV